MIGMIFAQSSNGFIGKDNQLLFSIPADMKLFKKLTDGKIVIMGRKTWDSLPAKFRPLPNRVNIVLTTQAQVLIGKPEYEGATLSRSLKEAIDIAKTIGDIWIIGGESVYKEAMKYVDVIHQTFVTKEFVGDAKAPFIDANVWTPETGKPFMEHNGLLYQFNIYNRINHDLQKQNSKI